jgi:hypothetical protein
VSENFQKKVSQDSSFNSVWRWLGMANIVQSLCPELHVSWPNNTRRRINPLKYQYTSYSWRRTRFSKISWLFGPTFTTRVHKLFNKFLWQVSAYKPISRSSQHIFVGGTRRLRYLYTWRHWSHLTQKLPSKTSYWRKDTGADRSDKTRKKM